MKETERTHPFPLGGGILDTEDWQMSLGERAALEGILSHLGPSLSIEIGRGDGGSLRRIAAHSKQVHSVDIDQPTPELIEELDNVAFHSGDSSRVLPALLERLAAEESTIDFALVDGDHTAEGVRTDLVNLLSSPALSEAVVVMHDTMNEQVRAGIESVPESALQRVAYMDIDVVSGFLQGSGPFEGELWGGLGLIVVAESATGRPPTREARIDPAVAMRRLRREYHASERTQSSGALHDEVEGLRAAVRGMQGSWSWRLTAPFRAAKRLTRRRR